MTQRTKQAIDQEYLDTCAKLGHLKFQSELATVGIKELTDRLMALSKEAAELAATTSPEGAKNE